MDKITAAKVFIDVAYSGSFSATSKRLEMSRSKVTRYIETLEDWFNVRLLNRSTRSMSLTTAGNACLNDVKLWVENADKLSTLVASNDELIGRIRISTSISFSLSQLIPAVTDFMRIHPKVDIDFDMQDAVIDLADKRIDLAVRIGPTLDTSVKGKSIGICEWVLVASPKYLSDMPSIKTPKDLYEHQCLGHSNSEFNTWNFSKEGTSQSIKLKKPSFTANDGTTLLKASMHDAGLVLLPRFLANSYIAEGLLEVVLPDWKTIDMKIFVAYASNKNMSPAVKGLIHHLEAYFQKNPW